MKKLFFLFIIAMLLTSCRNEEPNPEGLFHLTMGMEGGADVAMGIHDAEVMLNGYHKDIEVTLVGDFDSFAISGGLPSWLTVNAKSDDSFLISVSRLTDDVSRSSKVEFVVTKGRQTQPGSITIVQNPLTLEDLKATERRAIKTYLSKFDIVDGLPSSISDIQVGSVAPFYKLDSAGDIYMQVVDMGTMAKAEDGGKIYFRYLRYNLLSYLENRVLPKGEGNLHSLDLPASYFIVGSGAASTLSWGPAIPMPMELGLPVGSEVNLVVASVAGPAGEISEVIPFLYNIRYYGAEQKNHEPWLLQ